MALSATTPFNDEKCLKRSWVPFLRYVFVLFVFLQIYQWVVMPCLDLLSSIVFVSQDGTAQNTIQVGPFFVLLSTWKMWLTCFSSKIESSTVVLLGLSGFVHQRDCPTDSLHRYRQSRYTSRSEIFTLSYLFLSIQVSFNNSAPFSRSSVREARSI